MTSRFDDETAVRQLGDGRFAATMAERGGSHRGPNGGYLAAVILRALTDAVDDPDRTPRSLTVHYASPAGAGDVEIATSLDRVGRSMTTCTARWSRTASSSRSRSARSRRRATGIEFCDLVMPQVPGPQHYVARPVPPESPPIAHRWETRWAIGHPPVPGMPRGCACGRGRLDPAARGPRGRRARRRRDHRRLDPADVQPHPGAGGRADRRPHDPLPGRAPAPRSRRRRVRARRVPDDRRRRRLPRGGRRDLGARRHAARPVPSARDGPPASG